MRTILYLSVVFILCNNHISSYQFKSNRFTVIGTLQPLRSQPTHIGEGTVIEGRWYSKEFDQAEIESWWNSISKPLLTIGVNGVKASQINSIKELLISHGRIRVKLSNDKMDPHTVVDEIMKSDSIKDVCTPLHIRSREIMFGRTHQ